MTKHQQKKNRHVPTVTKIKSKTIGMALANILVLILLVCTVITFTDRRGWFVSDETNNHTKRKWDAFYKFTRTNQVDVVLVGNSHLYAGINPKNLSCALGANCFIMAAPGTTLTDAYYCLREAISVCKPKIAIIETYAINDYYSHELTGGPLSDQLQSFRARKNLWQKLAATPLLFTPGNYPAAWSNTIRNHCFIFTNPTQILKNMQKKKSPKDNKLYLGRFVSFPRGMTDSTLLKYDVIDGIVDGSNFNISNEAIGYIKKTVDLCRKHDIQLIFLTIPMYHRHVKNYDTWKASIEKHLKPYNPVWLDMQSPYDFEAFTPVCFENSVRSNQHMSYPGSLVATYKLAHFLEGAFPGLLPDRSGDARWNQLFYADEGYFENFPPLPDDPANTVLARDISLSGVTIKEIDLIERKEDCLLLAKVDRLGTPDLSGKRLQLVTNAILNGQEIVASVEASMNSMYDPPKHYLFMANIRKDVVITAIRGAILLNEMSDFQNQ